jgi:transcriptional regulator with XRE-family HTH domain
MTLKKSSPTKASKGNNEKTLIGKRIKTLRTQLGQTQADVAQVCELTKSMLSKVEKGIAYPSVAALVRIAHALGTTVSALMEHGDSDRPVYVRKSQAEKTLIKAEKGYAVFPYGAEFPDKKMQAFLFVAKKGEVKKHVVSHPGEEFIYVIEGEIAFRVGDEEFTMKPGDTLFFNAANEHGMMPLTPSAKYIDVFC